MRRQLLVIALVVLVAVIAVVSCTVKRVKDKKSVQVTEQQSSQKSTAKEDKNDTQETEKERLKRVKEEAKAAGYPEKVIALLSKNPETVDFVENYGEKKDAAPAETIEELKEGEILVSSSGMNVGDMHHTAPILWRSAVVDRRVCP